MSLILSENDYFTFINDVIYGIIYKYGTFVLFALDFLSYGKYDISVKLHYLFLFYVRINILSRQRSGLNSS